MSESKSKWWVALATLAVLAVAAPAQAQPYVYALGKVPGQPYRQYLTVINAATNAKGPSIELGPSNGILLPHAMAMAPDGARIYVVNDFDHTVSVVSTATNTVEDTWPASLVGTNLRALAVSPDNQRLYIVGNHQLFIAIDIASRSRIATVPVNLGGSYGVAASPDGSRVYVMATASNRVAVLGTAPYGVLTTVALSGNYVRSDSLSLSPNGRFAYIPQRSTYMGEVILSGAPGPTPERVSVLDTTTNTIVATTTVGAAPWHVAVSPNGATVYATSYTPSGAMHRLSPSTHASLGTTAVSRSFVASFLPDSTRAYVAARENVFAIDTATHAVTATIPFAETVDGRALAIVTTPPPYDPPPPPSNLRATVTGNRVSLTWDAPTSDTLIGYVLEGGVTPGQVLAALPTGGTATSFVFDAPTGAFYVRMHALTAAGRSPASNEIRIFVNVAQAPSAPAGLLGLANGSNLALSWKTTSAGGGPTSLVLDVSGALTTSVPVSLGETFSFAGVPAGTYMFAVRAVNSAGTSAASSPVTLAFPSACPGPPQAPTNLAVSRAGSQLSVSWDPPSAGPAVSSYVLKVAGALSLELPMSTRSISGTVPPGTYHLSVLAVNPCGSGVETPAQSVTVP